MRVLLALVFIFSALCANENIITSEATDSNSESIEDSDLDSNKNTESDTDSDLDSDKKYPNYEFPSYEDTSFLNSLIHRFSMHDENYFMPVYYSISGIRAPYKRIESKFQISMKANIFSDIFWGIGLYFAYTQKSFFQIYSPKISSPFRDSEYIPEVMFYRSLDWDFLGGKFYNFRLGYRHNSNGIGEGDGNNADRSRGTDRILAQIMYKNGNFDAHLTATLAYISKTASMLKDYKKYMGWSDLVLSYRFLEKNELKLTIKNLFHNYTNYKGSVMLEYKFNFDLFAIYLQYFYGYGDNIYQFNIKSHNIGIGMAISRF